MHSVVRIDPFRTGRFDEHMDTTQLRLDDIRVEELEPRVEFTAGGFCTSDCTVYYTPEYIGPDFIGYYANECIPGSQ